MTLQEPTNQREMIKDRQRSPEGRRGMATPRSVENKEKSGYGNDCTREKKNPHSINIVIKETVPAPKRFRWKLKSVTKASHMRNTVVFQK